MNFKKRGRGASRNFLLNGILIFLVVRSPSKISESYDNPFLDFSNGGNNKKRIKFPLAPMGSLLPGLHTLDPPLSPPSTLMETFWRTCLGWGVKKLKQFLINFLAISGNSKHFSVFSGKKPKQSPPGAGGVPRFFSLPQILFFL